MRWGASRSGAEKVLEKNSSHSLHCISLRVENGMDVGCALLHARQRQADFPCGVEVNCACSYGRMRLSARTRTFSRQATAALRTLPGFLQEGDVGVGFSLEDGKVLVGGVSIRRYHQI